MRRLTELTMVQGSVDRGSMGWGSEGNSKDEEGEGSCRDLHLPGVQAELAGGLLGSLEPQLCSCIYRKGRIRKSPGEVRMRYNQQRASSKKGNEARNATGSRGQ